MNMTIAEVLWATGGTSLHPRSLAPTAATQRIRHVALDSRQVQPGSLFVALPGERVDGHDFVEAAFAAGAAVALVAAERWVGGPSPGVVIAVADTVVALQQLACVHRSRQPATRLVITGSNGKTTLRHILATVLAERWATYEPESNLNSDVGLPLAMEVVEAGFSCIGVDVSESRVAQANEGKSYIIDISDEQLGKAVSNGLYRATTDYAEVAKADAISICVPTPLRKTRSYGHRRRHVMEVALPAKSPPPSFSPSPPPSVLGEAEQGEEMPGPPLEKGDVVRVRPGAALPPTDVLQRVAQVPSLGCRDGQIPVAPLGHRSLCCRGGEKRTAPLRKKILQRITKNLKMKKINLKNILKKTFKKKQPNKKKTNLKKVKYLKNSSKYKNIPKKNKSKKKDKKNLKQTKKKGIIKTNTLEKTVIKNDILRISKNNEQKPEIKKVKKQETEKREYKIKDYVVYPKHGVGQITEFKKINIGGIDVETYILKFEKDKANGMVPVNKQSHLRPLATINQVNKCISILKGKPKIKRSMWSRRAQEYEAKISSGKIYDLAEVVRDLNKGDDLMIDQSYSERQLFEKAYDRLLTEFQIVMGTNLDDTQKKLDKALKRNLEKQIPKVEQKSQPQQLAEISE